MVQAVFPQLNIRSHDWLQIHQVSKCIWGKQSQQGERSFLGSHRGDSAPILTAGWTWVSSSPISSVLGWPWQGRFGTSNVGSLCLWTCSCPHNLCFCYLRWLIPYAGSWMIPQCSPPSDLVKFRALYDTGYDAWYDDWLDRVEPGLHSPTQRWWIDDMRD